MDSSSSPSNQPHPPLNSRFKPPSQAVADRVFRALRHNLRLLHRSESNFYILGATGNVYNVTLAATPSCTCPDRITPCKHILFILIRVLGVSLDDACLRRKNLRPCKLHQLLRTQTLPGALAGARVRERFHEMFFRERARLQGGGGGGSRRDEDSAVVGGTCPVCLEEMMEKGGQKVVACTTCRNGVHEECLMKWKRSRGRRAVSCVMCRARWRSDRNRTDQEKYVNLGAYITDDQDDGETSGVRICGD